MAAGRIYVGTSGWVYPHWKGSVYPEGVRKGDYLRHYAKSLGTVEINNTFYRLPERETFTTWRRQTPGGFFFAVKASRTISHVRKLKEADHAVSAFFEHVRGLGEKLGPVLFQLPPRWKANPGRLDCFLAKLPRGFRCAFEFRDRSWFSGEIRSILRKRGAAFCITHMGRFRSPEDVTADFVYVRLHGPRDRYRGKYRAPTIRKWKRRIAAWRSGGRDVYIYFDNDDSGYAFKNAIELKASAEGAGAGH